MKITVDKCEFCGKLFETDSVSGIKEYTVHMGKEIAIQELIKRFPKVPDSHCNFANGEYSVQRSKEFFKSYRDTLVSLVNRFGDGSDYQPLSYGWYRCLNDGHSMFYRLSCRINCFCCECYKEWGQPAYANKCSHLPDPELNSLAQKKEEEGEDPLC